MEHKSTSVNSSQNMYPTAYLSNSSRTPSFQHMAELNVSLSPQVLIHVLQQLRKQASDSRCRLIFRTKDITRTYRDQSILSSQTDFAGYLDVSNSCIGAICGLIRIAMATLPLTLQTIKHREHCYIFTHYTMV